MVGLLIIALLATFLSLYMRNRRLMEQVSTLETKLEETSKMHEERMDQFRMEQEEGERQKEMWRSQAKNMEQAHRIRLYTHLLDHLATRPLAEEDFKLVSKFVDQNADVVGRKAKDMWKKIEDDPESAEQRLEQLQEHLKRKLAKLQNGEEPSSDSETDSDQVNEEER